MSAAGRLELTTMSFNATVDGGEARSVRFDESSIVTSIGRSPTDHVMDLVELITAIHYADRMTKRPRSTRAGDVWSRHLRLRIGVWDPQHWNRDEVCSELQRTLSWLTDDHWEFAFVDRETPRRSAECVRFLFDTPPAGDAIALFSGGLDSVAGLIGDVENGVEPIAFSVHSNSRMVGSQRSVLQGVRELGRRSVTSLPFELHLTAVKAVEKSQRARGFTFLGLAGVAAAMIDRREVRVYENGVGALNLPYTATQTGAHGTHSMHPVTLKRMSAFLSLALESDIAIVNPSELLTKAEMCATVPARYWPALRESESCDTAFASRKNPHACGTCTSCLLRRQTFHGAGLPNLDDPADYRVDAFEPTFWENKNSYDMRCMVGQAAEILEALQAADVESAMLQRFPDLAHWLGDCPMSEQTVPVPGVSRLLKAYAAEWRMVPSRLIRDLLSTGNELASSNPEQLTLY